MPDPISFAASLAGVVGLVATGYSHLLQSRRNDHGYNTTVTALEYALRNLNRMNESGRTEMRGFQALLPEGSALHEIQKLYREVGPVSRDSLLLVQGLRIHSPIYARWPHHTRQKRIVAAIDTVRESLDGLLSAITSMETRLVKDIQACLPTARLDDFTQAAIEALLVERLLLPADQLLATSRTYDAQKDVQSTRRVTSEVIALASANEAVLGFLEYETMFNRKTDISDGPESSLAWVYDETSEKSTTLSTWLRNGQGIENYQWLENDQWLFLIAGKEGSGKSTLMKHILNHPQTVTALENWTVSGYSSLVIADFFFWRSGSPLQRTEEGLLRSLIYGVLSQKPEFAPQVLPQQWAKAFESIIRGGNGLVPEMTIWKVENLWSAFKRLFDLPIKILFLVDGLDEYQDDKGICANMVEKLTNGVKSSRNTKILASTRLNRDFNTLQIKPDIVVDKSNHEAIRRYVYTNLDGDPNFKAAEARDRKNGSQVIGYLLSTANGSFLWVKVAVKMIQKQLSQCRTLEDIYWERRTRLPGGMPALYRQLWSDMSIGQQEQASEILQVVLAWRSLTSPHSDSDEAMRLVDLAFAIGDPFKTVKMRIYPWSLDSIRRECHSVAECFTSTWTDFIRIDSKQDIVSARIEFCQRSILEFLEHERTRRMLKDHSPRPNFCPYICHLKSSVQHLKILPNRLHMSPLPLLWVFVRSALLAANRVDSGESAKFPSYELLLKELDRTMRHYHGNKCKDPASIYQTRYLESRIQDADGTVEWRDRGRDYKRIAKMHWSNFHFDHKCSHPRDWRDSFLSLAIQFGLKNYVKQTLQGIMWPQRTKKGRPLLNYALAPSPIAPYSLITPELVEILLAHGSKVGEKFEKKSCWEHALRWQYETFAEVNATAARGSRSGERGLEESRAQIFLMLLKNGADTKASIETSRGLILPAKSVVELSFKNLTLESTYEELQRFLA